MPLPKHIAVNVGCGDLKAVPVADAGCFWVTKTRWQDVLEKYHPWSRIMGYVLTHKRTGFACGWFRDIGSALVCADELKEVCGEEWLDGLEKLTKHEEAYQVVIRWREVMGDPFEVCRRRRREQGL